ncbi:MAG TPA: glycosyltransferase family 39 protein [Vicinamibacterales bacterium]|nr:glycosyltransferase family 39 protein [Vicinamibacterales bacterium]
MLPYDATSVTAIAAAAACLIAAWRCPRSSLSLTLVLLAALIIRIDPARQTSLHKWDEQFHAVVAKHMMTHPFQPELYQHPLGEVDPDDWTEGHVWLHKPPLAMWLMALSMKAFGVGAFAMRLPSVILSTLCVLLTFVIGRRLFDDRVGLLAAGFQAVNGLLASLASGRRVADHVDTLLIACVELGMALLFVSGHVAPEGGLPSVGVAVLIGLTLGAGILAKSAPALIVVVVAAVLWAPVRPFRRGAGRLALVAFSAMALVLPWQIYTHIAFPREAAAAAAYTLRHTTHVVEGHGGPFWAYIADLPRYYGELVYIPLAWFLGWAWQRKGSSNVRALAAWLIVPYAVFSAMPTKLPEFVAIAAPAVFICEAAFWHHLRQLPVHRRPARIAVQVLMLLLLVLPARNLLQPRGVFARRDRHPPNVADLMTLDRRVGTPNAVVFNVPTAIEAMFYSRYDAYSRLPTAEEIQAYARRGTTVVVYVPKNEAAPSFPAGSPVRILRQGEPPKPKA